MNLFKIEPHVRIEEDGTLSGYFGLVASNPGPVRIPLEALLQVLTKDERIALIEKIQRSVGAD
jgi:hypothetical protein